MNKPINLIITIEYDTTSPIFATYCYYLCLDCLKRWYNLGIITMAFHLQNSLLLFLEGAVILVASVLVFITPQSSTDTMLPIAGFTALAMAIIYLLGCFFGGKSILLAIAFVRLASAPQGRLPPVRMVPR